MTIPNIITIFRIILIPIYLLFFYSDLNNSLLIAGAIFILAGISDFLDGYIARRYDQTSNLGTILDPIADKLMSFAILISFTTNKIIPSWILIFMSVKEGLMIVGGGVLYLFKGKQIVASNKFGKLATILFYVAALSVIFKLDSMVSLVLFSLMVIVNIIAFINYLLNYLKIRNKVIIE